jgi:D-glycero-alpha-D-manno-heptose-7-phosphate kinase
MQIHAQAPCRVDLAGGTLDIWPLYLYHAEAVTLNFAVTVQTSCRLFVTGGQAITLRSTDQKIEETFDSYETLASAGRYRHPLAAHVVRYFRPQRGLIVETASESPAGAGISGSSAMLIATVSAFNKLMGTGFTIERVREIAQNIEARIIQVPTGCQDYYPAMYGGVSAIELTPAGIRRIAMPVDAAELNSRFVLAYTGKPRNSGINNWEVTKAHIDGDKQVRRNFDRIASIAAGMRKALERSDWKETTRLLREEWNHRRKNAPGITTPLIDRLMEVTRKAGAGAGKVCGAGGGGCVVFLCEPDARLRVEDAVRSAGAMVLPVSVAPKGVRLKSEA